MQTGTEELQSAGARMQDEGGTSHIAFCGAADVFDGWEHVHKAGEACVCGGTI